METKKINAEVLKARIEAMKARTERAKNRKPLTPEEIRERVKNSPLIKTLKEAQEKKINFSKKEE